MSVGVQDLWTLTFGRPWIDPEDLAAALEREAGRGELDHRTRLLVRDSLNALCERWGRERLEAWLEGASRGAALAAIWGSDLGDAGFPSLGLRMMEPVKSETVRECLRELGSRLSGSARIVIGGSIALILSGELSRATEDIDVVDEVPAEIRAQHELLDELAKRYGLRITHFQSHYLPTDWERRVRSLGRFGMLQVDLIDTYDIFIGKLFSARTKDRDDLRMLARNLDRPKIETRLRDAGASLRKVPGLSENAVTNWYIVYGEPLPG